MIFGADDTPDFQEPQMDPGAQKFIDSAIKTKDQPVKSAYEESARAAASGSGLLPTIENVNRQEGALGMNNRAQTDAILKKGETLFSSDLRKMMLKNQMAGYEARQQQLGQKHTLSSRQWQFFEQIRQEKMRAEAARIATRNQVIGNVLGAVGMVAGAMVGGPMGAMVGGQLGKSVGGGGNSYQETNDRMWASKDYDSGE